MSKNCYLIAVQYKITAEVHQVRVKYRTLITLVKGKFAHWRYLLCQTAQCPSHLRIIQKSAPGRTHWSDWYVPPPVEHPVLITSASSPGRLPACLCL